MTERPIKEQLSEPLDDRDLMRVWHRVSKVRSAPATPRLPWAIATVAVIALVIALWPRDVVETAAPIEDRIEGAAVTKLFETPRDVSYLLASGRIEVSIVPGHRRVIFECGIATVEVVGTRFTIDRRETSVLVEVHEGTVLVRSPYLVDVRLVSAGDRLLVEVPPPPAPPPPPIEPEKPIVKRPVVVPPVETPPTPDAGPPAPTAEELLALADQMRRDGRHAEAADLLRQLIRDFPSEPRAALASFSLGKIELDVNARPKEAAEAFERALAIGLPAVLVEDAYARLVESQLRAGDRAAASETAKKYLMRFPRGHHRARLEKIAR